MEESIKNLLLVITSFYLESREFNGYPILSALNLDGFNEETLVSCLVELINEEKVSLVFGDRHPNPHIKALEAESNSKQINKLEQKKLDHVCAYPLRKHLLKVVDKSLYLTQPFKYELALGVPQLALRSFDLSILEFYRNDPRYMYYNNDISGSISISDEYHENVPTSDRIILQTFGFCYTDEMNRAVAAYPWYLSKLSPEHQQIWKAKQINGDYWAHPDYYRITAGHFPIGISIFRAFLEEIHEINLLSIKMNRQPLFKKDFKDQKPDNFTFLIRPTQKEYDDFIKNLDIMLSDNLNLNFFQNDVHLFENRVENGVLITVKRGTLSILDEWLKSKWITDDYTQINELISTFRKIRRERNKPSHTINDNIFDQKYFQKQRETIKSAYYGVNLIRQMFSRHPYAQNYVVPRILSDYKIWTY